MTDTLTNICGAPGGAPADSRITYNQMGGDETRDLLGGRDYVRNDEQGELWFRYGRRRDVVQTIVVKLMADDTYSVQRGEMPKTGPAAYKYVPTRQEHGIYCDGLRESVLRVASAS